MVQRIAYGVCAALAVSQTGPSAKKPQHGSIERNAFSVRKLSNPALQFVVKSPYRELLHFDCSCESKTDSS